MSDQKVRVEVDGGVATVFLVNPPMNVMTLDMRRELDAALTRLEADPAIGALVLTGDGDRVFRHRLRHQGISRTVGGRCRRVSQARS